MLGRITIPYEVLGGNSLDEEQRGMEGAVVQTQRFVTVENRDVWECELAAEPGSFVLLPPSWVDVAYDGGLHYCSAGKEGKGRAGGMERAQARPRRGKGRGAGSARPGGCSGDILFFPPGAARAQAARFAGGGRAPRRSGTPQAVSSSSTSSSS